MTKLCEVDNSLAATPLQRAMNAAAAVVAAAMTALSSAGFPGVWLMRTMIAAPHGGLPKFIDKNDLIPAWNGHFQLLNLKHFPGNACG
jgi:hypothetical protein